MTALVIAAIKNHEEIVDMLLKAGANPNIINRVCCNNSSICSISLCNPYNNSGRTYRTDGSH